MTSLTMASASRIFCCSDVPGQSLTMPCGMMLSLNAAHDCACLAAFLLRGEPHLDMPAALAERLDRLKDRESATERVDRDVNASAGRVHRNGVTVGDEHHYTVWPPSTTMAWPTTKEAASEHSQRTALAISSGRPILPTGSCAITLSRPSAVPPVKRSIIGV